MKCENCGTDHDGSYGSGRFCDSKCARGFSTKSKRKEINKKISESLTGREGWVPKDKRRPFTKEEASRGGKITAARSKAKAMKRWLEEGKFPREVIKEVLYKEQDNKCDICGNPPIWMGKPLVFIIDHIDGDASNNKRENLRAVCSNCDSQLDTYKSKNKNSSRKNRKKYY